MFFRLRNTLFLSLTAWLFGNLGGRVVFPQAAPASPQAQNVVNTGGAMALAYATAGTSLRGVNDLYPSGVSGTLSAPQVNSTDASILSAVPIRPRLGRSTYALPWVGTVEWDVPDDYGASAIESHGTISRPWAHFEEELILTRVASVPPKFAGVTPLPLFPVLAPWESDFSSKLKRLARAKLYREVRLRVRREWKSVFLNHPSLTYSDYEQRLFQINNIGKNVEDRDDFAAISSATEVKQSFFGNRRVDGEADIPFLAWGPFILKDSGSLKFDLGRAVTAEADEESLEVGDEKRAPLVATRDYEIQTALNFDVDPFRGAVGTDYRESVRQAGVSIEVSWLSAVLGRELFSTELDLESDLYGDFKGFFSIVIKSR